MCWSRRRAKWALLACLGVAPLALPAVAGAANDGTLRQLAAPFGCLAVQAVTGCGSIAGPLTDAVEPAFAPSGRHLYVPGRTSNSMLVLARNPATGRLTQQACFTLAVVAGCEQLNVGPMERPESIAISGDGTSLYLVGSNFSGGSRADGIVQFDLDPATGAPTYRGCYATAAVDGCVAHVGLASATSVVVSRDGRSVYVAGDNGGGVIGVFQRDRESGVLSQVALQPASARCVRRTTAEGCTAVTLLNNPRDIEITPDGKQLLVANAGCVAPTTDCYGVLAFDRGADGALALHPGKGGCVSSAVTSLVCNTRPGFTAYTQLALAADGRQIYAIARSGALLLIDRNPATGDLSPRMDWCASLAAACPVAPAEALSDPFDVAVSPDERAVYTSAATGRLGVFDRRTDGGASPKPGEYGCLATTANAACPGALGGGGPGYSFLVPSPDGRHVYAIGSTHIVTLRVDRAPVCNSLSVGTPFNTSTTIALRCSDADGDPVANYRIVRQPARGQLGALQGTSVAYGSLVGLSGPDTFTYTARAAGIDADPATVTVDVGPPPQPACVDVDGDGFCASQDCDDGNPSIRPNAREVPGNLVDENCDSVVAPFPVLATPISATWRVKGARVKLTSLLLRAPLPKGLKVELRCRGKGCPVTRRALSGKASKGRMNVYKSLRGKVNFKAGQVLEIRVSAPSFTGKVLRYTLRRSRIPAGVPLCIPAGTSTPRRAC